MSQLTKKYGHVVQNIIFWYIHCSTIYIFETVPQFNDNLMTQFNEWKGYNGIRIIKIFQFENTRADVKEVLRSLKKKKEKDMSGKSHTKTRGKVTPVFDFTNEPVIRCNVPIAENRFVDYCK